MATLEEHLIFLASPGDVKKERGLVAEIIDRLNRSVARKRGLYLRLISWEKDAFPAYGSDPQEIINQQIAEMSTYTLFVGIMWNRLGSPTPRGDSGTVEEFTRATASFAIHGRPHIWFYFRNSAAKLDTQEQLDQRAKVLAFKKGIQANALAYAYKDTRVFKEQLQDHLLMWLDTIPDREKTTITKAAESQSPEEQALAAAKRSLDANSISDQKERVKIKDSCGNEIAELILREKLTKDWVVEQVPVQAVHRQQDALISGLAIAITVSPEAQDFQRLLRVALSCQWPNAQHKVCIAMSKLFSAGFAKKEDVPDAVRILNDFLRRGADRPLKRRIFETAAVISRSTGVSINLPK